MEGYLKVNFSRPIFTVIFRPKVAFVDKYRFHFEGKNDVWLTHIVCVLIVAKTNSFR